jgi:hypothetical protein
MPHDFCISFRIWHPTRKADDLIAAFGASPKIAHSVGEPRQRPDGVPLSGHYEKTYLAFDLNPGPDVWLKVFLTEQLSRNPLLGNDDLLNDIHATGGVSEFFVSIEGEIILSLLFEVDLLSTLARKKIRLALDVHENEG